MGDRIKKARTIVFVTHEFTKSGAPLCLLEIVRLMTAQGRRCIVVGPPRGLLLDEFLKTGGEFLPIAGISWLYAGAKRGKVKLLYLPIRILVNCWLQLVLWVQFVRLKPDVIHLNSFAARFAALPARYSSSRTVWYLLEYYQFQPFLKRAAQSLVALCSDCIVGGSEMTLDWWSGGLSGPRHEILYNAVEASSQRPVPFKEKEFDVVYLGRYSPEKGVGELVEAVALLAAQGTSLRVAMVGSYESRRNEEWLRALIREHGVENHFSWYENHPLPSDILRRSRVLALPSHREGLGRAVLEAMACRVPVLGSNTGGIPEAVQNNVTGILCPVGDVGAIARGLKHLACDESVNERLGNAAYRLILERFSFEVFSRRLVEIYDGVQS
jgi:glycosyltransferase involved in cell wall biosynthesis